VDLGAVTAAGLVGTLHNWVHLLSIQSLCSTVL
jgi:hypothetical protein